MFKHVCKVFPFKHLGEDFQNIYFHPWIQASPFANNTFYFATAF